MFERNKKDGDKSGSESSRQEIDQLLDTGGASKSAPRAATGTGGRTEVAVIGRSIRIDGDLRGDEDLRIEGDVTGMVQLKNNTLTIGSEGKISANVYAKSVTVDGLMDGDVFASESVSIRKNAQVKGNIIAPRVALEDGARFKGSIEMDPAAVEAAFGRDSGAARPGPSDPAAKISAMGKNEGRNVKAQANGPRNSAKSESVN